jgi:hypothetical protein
MSDDYGSGPYKGYLGYGDPGSFAGSEGRRKIVAALLAKQRKYPTNIGEGIASIGENIGNVLYLNALADEDKARGAFETNLGKGLPEIPVAGAEPAVATPSASTGVSPAAAPPAPIQPPAAAEHIPGANAGLPQTEFPNLGNNFKPPVPPAGMLPVINASRFNPTITNKDSGSSVIAGQLSPQSFGNKAYGPLPNVPIASVTPNAEPDIRDQMTQTIMAQARPPLTRTAALPSSAATDASAPSPDIPFAALSPEPTSAAPRPSVPPLTATAQSEPYSNPPLVQPGITKAPTGTLPSQEPVPPAAPPYVTQIPPEQKRPGILGISPEQAKARAILNDPRIDPNGPLARRAQQIETYFEGARKEKERQLQADYEHQRGIRDALVAKEEQRKYEADSKALDERYRRGQIELQNATTPTARAKAEADLAKISQEIAAGKAPETIKFENGKVGQWDQKTGAYKDITPQINPLDIDIPAELGKKMEFYIRAKGASDALVGDAGSMTNLASALGTRSLNPIFGNYVVTPEFRRDYNLAKAWGQAVLRDESGAALSEKEVERKMDIYWPVPNDPPEIVAQKAANRRREETSFYLSLGKARPVADFYIDRKTEQPEGAVLKDPGGNVRRVVRNGLWMDVPNGR